MASPAEVNTEDQGSLPMSASWISRHLLRRRGAETVEERPRAGEGDAEKLWYLQHIDLFQDMTPKEMHRLAMRTKMRRYERGQLIAHPDDAPDTIYLVKEGRVKLCRYSAGGRVQILALLERGNIFGERALVGAPEAVHCEAFEDTLICVLRRRDFEELLRSKPEMALRVMKVLAERLKQAEEAVESLAFRDVPERLAALLSKLVEAYGEPHDGGRRLALRFTHQDLASMIGATRETVTNVLHRFRDEGMITVEDRHIVIRDLGRLEARRDPASSAP